MVLYRGLMRALTLLLLFLALPTQATVLGLITVKMPLYLHGSDSDSEITLTAVPFVTAYSHPEATFAAVSKPFIPPSDGSWKPASDINLASLYKIQVSAADESSDKLQQWVITIDASSAKVPEGYPFSLNQVIDAVTTCVKSMCPNRPDTEHKIIVKVIAPKK